MGIKSLHVFNLNSGSEYRQDLFVMIIKLDFILNVEVFFSWIFFVILDVAQSVCKTAFTFFSGFHFI